MSLGCAPCALGLLACGSCSGRSGALAGLENADHQRYARSLLKEYARLGSEASRYARAFLARDDSAWGKLHATYMELDALWDGQDDMGGRIAEVGASKTEMLAAVRAMYNRLGEMGPDERYYTWSGYTALGVAEGNEYALVVDGIAARLEARADSRDFTVPAVTLTPEQQARAAAGDAAWAGKVERENREAEDGLCSGWAFAEDPLAFLKGCVWDKIPWWGKLAGGALLLSKLGLLPKLNMGEVTIFGSRR